MQPWVEPPSNNKSNNHAIVIVTIIFVVILIALLVFASVHFAKKKQCSNSNQFRQIADKEVIESVELVSKHGRFMV